MQSEKVFNALNDQMNYEFYSAHQYLATAAYCSHESLDGFANFFLVQAEEERFHAMKFYHFINDLGGRATITSMGEPKNEFTSVLDAFKVSLEHEKEVTRRIHQLADLAMEERYHPMMTFLNWFIEEQVEEEASFEKLIDRIKRIDNDTNSLDQLDIELGKRTFSPEDEE